MTVTVIPGRAQTDRIPPAGAVRPGVVQEETDSADSADSPGPEPSSGWRRSAICNLAGHPLRAASLSALSPAEGLETWKRKNESRLLSPDLRIEIWALGKEDTAQLAPFWKTFSL